MSLPKRSMWDPQAMLHLLSKQRMATYLDAMDGNIETAFVLYNRNIQLATALQGMTAMVEVVARNAIDRALTEWNAKISPHTDWFDLDVLDDHAQKDIAIARQRVLRLRKPVTHSKVLAELSFGFW